MPDSHPNPAITVLLNLHPYLSMLSLMPEVRARLSQAERAATTGACAIRTVCWPPGTAIRTVCWPPGTAEPGPAGGTGGTAGGGIQTAQRTVVGR